MILPSTVPPVEEVAQLIAEALNPRRIVLFGSRARGTARPDSDIDLMVELETAARPVDRAFAVRRLFGLRYWSMDVVVYTPEEVVRLRKCLSHAVARHRAIIARQHATTLSCVAWRHRPLLLAPAA